MDRQTGADLLPPTVFVIFGVTGDLARRKILPAIRRLDEAGLLPRRFCVVGVNRKGLADDDVVAMLSPEFASRASAVQMRIDEPSDYPILARRLAELDRAEGVPLARLYYLAIPAPLFKTVATRLSEVDFDDRALARPEPKYLVEKPFGHDLASARELVDLVDSRFAPSQVFRIDHYLAKETAQNILSFRFGNPIFSRAWNGDHISHVMITASEEIGIEGRSAFYEGMGAFRDLVQSHLLQLLALVAMDRPASFSSEDIHRAKEEFLSRVMPPSPGDMPERSVRGQYAGYREEVGNPDSQTETYAAARLSIDADGWRNVPVLIRTGKSLREKVTEIVIAFSDEGPYRNYLTLRIQPNEGIVVDLRIKKPGFDAECEDVQLDFCYDSGAETGEPALPESYERVLYDALRGDGTLFATGREILECWRISTPILDAWADDACPLFAYARGSWGPIEAASLARDAGVEWFDETHRVCPVRVRLT
jgi:glucose-6-phosphate 1-dehydrogenase